MCFIVGDLYLCFMVSKRSGRGKEQRKVSTGLAEVSWQGSHATVFLDGVESSHINVDHPEELEFEYMQHMSAICAAWLGATAPLRALHLGGAANALPWAWSILHPRSRQTVAEIDPLLIVAAREWFDLPKSPELKIRCQDGRLSLDTSRPGAWDVIVRDAFAAGKVPAHLATYEACAAAARALRPGGLYLLNSAHGGDSDARMELPALQESFSCVFAVVDPKVGKGGRRGNVVYAAVNPTRSGGEVDEAINECDRLLRRLPLPARIIRGRDLQRWQAGQRGLCDQEVGWEGSEAPASVSLTSSVCLCGDGSARRRG